ATAPPGKDGVTTHMSIQALVGCALETGSRTALLRECRELMLHHGRYAESQEELTPLRWDGLSAVCAVGLAGALVVVPALAQRLVAGVARSSQMSPETMRAIRVGLN